ncbi:HD domain-containing phosphohydrolase [Deinococcus sp. YIM 134068]|uniref:HD domain-containing phosphohydrolase n=1 Tax=Deinococcus lichenicola TaxID=3118910 RepID=UPI002F91CEF1
MRELRRIDTSPSSIQTAEAERLTALLEEARAARANEARRGGPLMEEALPLARALGDSVTLAEVLFLLGLGRYVTGDFLGAFGPLEEALTLFTRVGDVGGEADTLMNLGGVLGGLGDHAQALESLLRARDRYAALGHAMQEAKTAQHIAVVHANRGEFGAALPLHEFALARHREAGHERGMGYGLSYVGATRVELAVRAGARGDAARARAELEAALPLLEEAVVIGTRLANLRQVAFAATAASQAEFELGRMEAAEGWFSRAVAAARGGEDRATEAYARMEAARQRRERGDVAGALGELTAAQLLLDAAGARHETVMVLRDLVDLHELAGDTTSALAALRQLHTLELALRDESAEARWHLARARYDVELHRLRSQELEELVQERTQQLEASHFALLERLAVVAEFRDAETADHTRRVGTLAALLAGHLGVPQEEVRMLRLAARLHDIGKIAVPDDILLKPGRLTPDEWTLIQTHTTVGAQMLGGRDSPLLAMAEEIAWTHHERWDGEGYPRGLGGEDIPLVGRLVAVADVYDALSSVRPYKAAWPLAEVVGEIERGVGTRFDPRVVGAFLDLIGTGRWPPGEGGS